MSTVTIPRRKIPFFVPILNPLMTLFVRLGVDLGPKMALITIRGRRTGRPLTTPITLFETSGRRYVFGTFGNTSWVRNARAAGELTLTRGRRHEVVDAIPLPLSDAATILRECLTRFAQNPTMAPMLRTFYGIGGDLSTVDFDEIARQHPGFELRDTVRSDRVRRAGDVSSAAAAGKRR